MKIKKFTFNTFQENTYVIESMNKCIIVDPGCSNKEEASSNMICFDWQTK